jgi:hypothetical protein
MEPLPPSAVDNRVPPADVFSEDEMAESQETTGPVYSTSSNSADGEATIPEGTVPVFVPRNPDFWRPEDYARIRMWCSYNDELSYHYEVDDFMNLGFEEETQPFPAHWVPYYRTLGGHVLFELPGKREDKWWRDVVYDPPIDGWEISSELQVDRHAYTDQGLIIYAVIPTGERKCVSGVAITYMDYYMIRDMLEIPSIVDRYWGRQTAEHRNLSLAMEKIWLAQAAKRTWPGAGPTEMFCVGYERE